MLPENGGLQKILDLTSKAKAALYVEDIEAAYQAQIDIEVCVQEICAVAEDREKGVERLNKLGNTLVTRPP
jgi:hypothetical protein